MHQFHFLRQKVVDSVLHNRVRLSAADLHDGPRPRHGPLDFGRELVRHLSVAIFVDVFHAVPRLRHGDLFELVHLGQVLVGPRGFLRIHFADGEADVHHDVLADLWIGNVLQAGLARDAAVIDAAHPHAALLLKLDDFSGNCQTHDEFTSAGQFLP